MAARGTHLGRCLAVVDACLCLLLFFPLSIFHWRGTWELQDIYILPHRFLDSNWVSFGIGANLCTILLLAQPSLATLIKPCSRPVYFIISRFFIYIQAWGIMFFWRGLWNLMDLYLTDHWLNSTVLYAVCQCMAFATKTLRTNVGIPVSIGLDTDPNLLAPDTLWKTEPIQTWKFVGDVIFTQFFIVTSNVALWRGMWNILDTFLYPEDHLMSDLASLVIGFAVIVLMFAIQLPSAMISEQLDKHKGWKICFESTLFLVLCWANLMLWRGGWDLCVHYVLPNSLIGPWMCHCIGTVGLMAFQVFNNVGLNGIERDGQYPQGEGLYPTKYLQVYLADFIRPQKKYSMLESDDTESDSGDSDYSDIPLKTLMQHPLVIEAEITTLPDKAITNGQSNGHASVHMNGHSNGHANGHINKDHNHNGFS